MVRRSHATGTLDSGHSSATPQGVLAGYSVPWSAWEARSTAVLLCEERKSSHGHRELRGGSFLKQQQVLVTGAQNFLEGDQGPRHLAPVPMQPHETRTLAAMQLSLSEVRPSPSKTEESCW